MGDCETHWQGAENVSDFAQATRMSPRNGLMGYLTRRCCIELYNGGSSGWARGRQRTGPPGEVKRRSSHDGESLLWTLASRIARHEEGARHELLLRIWKVYTLARQRCGRGCQAVDECQACDMRLSGDTEKHPRTDVVSFISCLPPTNR